MNDRQIRNRYKYYVEGSTVRKIDTQPYEQPMPRRQHEEKHAPSPRHTKKEKAKQRAYEKHDKALAFDFKYTAFVTISVLIMVSACVMMIFWMSRIKEQQNHISNLETQLENMQADNAAYKMSIDNMYSLDELYDAAVNELGMVYARKGQIVYYESADEDYVKQYQDVPETK